MQLLVTLGTTGITHPIPGPNATSMHCQMDEKDLKDLREFRKDNSGMLTELVV